MKKRKSPLLVLALVILAVAIPGIDAPKAADAAVPTEAPVTTEAPDTADPLDDVVVATINGRSILYKDVKADILEYAQQYASFIAMYYGQTVSPMDPYLFAASAEYIINSLIEEEIITAKIEEFALNSTPEQQAELETHIIEGLDSILGAYREQIKLSNPDADDEQLSALVEAQLNAEGYSTQIVRDDIRFAEFRKLVEAHVTADVTVNEEDVRTAYAAMVAQAKEAYAANPDDFLSDYMNGAEIAYTPEGYRLIQHILLYEEGEEGDTEKRAEAILAELQGGKDFEEAIAEYGQDPGMSEEFLKAGYPVREGTTSYVESFTTSAMALEKVGDISGLVSSDYGVHILRYAADLPSGEVPFETKQEAFTVSQLSIKKNEAMAALEQQWREAAGVTVDYAAIVPVSEPVTEPAADEEAVVGAATSAPETVTVPQPEIAPVSIYGQVSAEGTTLLDQPSAGGNALATLDIGVTLTIEGSIVVDGETWNYISLPDGIGQGYVKAASLASAEQVVPMPEGVHTQTIDATGKNPVFTLVMNDGSLLYGELYPATAPQSVGNFVALANSGFYNGLTFHRVVPSFVIQGGDPSGNGTGGPGHQIKGEFSSNGVENTISHKRGVLSMARSSMPDSAGSQFFICVADTANLDGDYAAFGAVLGGMETADAIVGVERGANDLPTQPQRMKLVHVETYGVDYPFEKLAQ